MKLDKCGGAHKNPLLSFSLTLNIKKPHRYNNLFNSERKAAKWPRRVPLIKLRLVSPCSSIQLTRIIPEQIRRNPHVYLTSATRRNCDRRRNRCCRKRTRQSKRCLFTSLADVVPARSVSVPLPLPLPGRCEATPAPSFIARLPLVRRRRRRCAHFHMALLMHNIEPGFWAHLVTHLSQPQEPLTGLLGASAGKQVMLCSN